MTTKVIKVEKLYLVMLKSDTGYVYSTHLTPVELRSLKRKIAEAQKA